MELGSLCANLDLSNVVGRYDELLAAEADGSLDTERYVKKRDRFFDLLVYRQRMTMSVEAFLCEADARGAEYGRGVYAMSVGLGLGVWGFLADQDQHFADIFADVLRSACWSPRLVPGSQNAIRVPSPRSFNLLLLLLFLLLFVCELPGLATFPTSALWIFPGFLFPLVAALRPATRLPPVRQ